MDGWFKLPPGAVPTPGEYMWRVDPQSPEIRVCVFEGSCYVGPNICPVFGGEWKYLSESIN